MPKRKNAVRADGRICVKVYLGRDVNGKTQYKYCFGKTQHDAEEKANAVKAAMRKGLDVTAERETFGIWASRWLDIKRQEVSAATVVMYESISAHLKRYLEYIEISKIRTADVQRVITDLVANNPNTGKSASKHTLGLVKATAAQILQLAIDNRVMDYNPAKAVKIPNIRREETRRALTEQERQWIADTPHRAQRAAMIMMYAGLRRGELIALTWNDIDLKEKTITVNKAVEVVDGKFILKRSTKTDAGRRVIDIPQKLIDFLSEEQREAVQVCVSAKGRLHTPSSWNRLWASYLADINIKYGDFSPFMKRPKSKFDPSGVPFVIPHITPHWLRHTFCTLLYLSGVDVLTAMKQMGHADIKITMQTYTHLDAKYQRKSMNKLDNFLCYGGQIGVSPK